MTTNQKIAQKLRETAAKLIRRAEELEAGKLPTAHVSRPTCLYGTERPCQKCGGKIVIDCNNPDVEKQTVSPGYCRTCQYFTAGSAGLQSGMSADETVSVRDNPCPYDPL